MTEAERFARQCETDLIGLRRTGTRRGVPIDGIETDADFFCVSSDEGGKPLRAMMDAGTSEEHRLPLDRHAGKAARRRESQLLLQDNPQGVVMKITRSEMASNPDTADHETEDS